MFSCLSHALLSLFPLLFLGFSCGSLLPLAFPRFPLLSQFFPWFPLLSLLFPCFPSLFPAFTLHPRIMAGAFRSWFAHHVYCAGQMGATRGVVPSLTEVCAESSLVGNQGCGIARGVSNHFCDIFGNLPLCMGVSVWEALSVVSQKWSFPTALLETWLMAYLTLRRTEANRTPTYNVSLSPIQGTPIDMGDFPLVFVETTPNQGTQPLDWSAKLVSGWHPRLHPTYESVGPVVVGYNVDRGFLSPLFINMGVFLVLAEIHHFWMEHPHINKRGCINPGST